MNRWRKPIPLERIWCLFELVCAMVRLSYHAELFYLAHQLVEEYPQQVKRAISAQYSARNSSARNSL